MAFAPEHGTLVEGKVRLTAEELAEAIGLTATEYSVALVEFSGTNDKITTVSIVSV